MRTIRDRLPLRPKAMIFPKLYQLQLSAPTDLPYHPYPGKRCASSSLAGIIRTSQNNRVCRQ